MKTLSHILVASLCVILFATSAFAWRSLRTGTKNFERAWSSYLFKRPDKATGYFTKAANAFGEALAEQPPSRSTMFPSNLAMAGMSFYHAGRYEESIDAMQKAIAKNRNIWEAPLYTALSHARLGDTTKAVESFNAYFKSGPSQAIISDTISRLMPEIENGSLSLEKAANEIDGATHSQFEQNVNVSGRSTPTDNDRCNGSFWWRYNRAPCFQKQLISD